MAETKQQEQAEAKVRVRHLLSVERDGTHYPAGSFEEDVSEQVAGALVASNRARRLGAGELAGDLPTQGADHTVASPPGTIRMPEVAVEVVEQVEAPKPAGKAAAPAAKS